MSELLEPVAADEAAGEHARWVTEIKLYEKAAEEWETKTRKIIRRYLDDRESSQQSKARFNILWSNVQTLLPALYAKNPKPDIERRFRDKDDLGRTASTVLERSTAYFVGCDTFGCTMKQAVLDRLLGGRATAWVRYVPHMRDIAISGGSEVKQEGSQVTDDILAGDNDNAPPGEEVYYEEVTADYVHWEDFGHTIARTWEEVRAVWRKAYLTRKELIDRFGTKKGEAIPLDYSPKGLSDEKINEALKKAVIYEIWDKPSKKAIWIHKAHSEILDTRPDPLRLKEFFPCPRPMYATLGNVNLFPTPDYVEYQDQAEELDNLTGRIRSLTKAVKVAGVYDASAEGIERLLSEGVENTLVPVDQFAVLGDKGGIKGVIAFFPMKEIADTLLTLYEARERVKSDLYEVTGISDIIRGASKASETATAQQIKGQYAGMRLSYLQDDTARFARDLVRIMAEIIASHFSIDTIKIISGVKLFSQAEKQQLAQAEQFKQQQMMMAQQAGQQVPPPPPMDKDTQEIMAQPAWEDVDGLLKDDAVMHFRIDIETDSTIKADEEAEKQGRVELLTSAAAFLQQAAQIQDPKIQPLMGKLLLFGLRGFKIGKELEGAFELAISDMEKAAENPAPPPENPELAKAKAQIQLDQQQAENDLKMQQAENDLKLQMEAQSQRQQIELERVKAAAAMEIEREKARNQMEIEKFKAQVDVRIKAALAEKQGEIADKKAEADAVRATKKEGA